MLMLVNRIDLEVIESALCTGLDNESDKGIEGIGEDCMDAIDAFVSASRNTRIGLEDDGQRVFVEMSFVCLHMLEKYIEVADVEGGDALTLKEAAASRIFKRINALKQIQIQ
jgi:sirohydrochlorin ferrochelatase